MAEVQSTFQLRPGDPAPEFRLPDADGRWFSRSEVTGAAGLLVVFACNHCPFVIHLADALGKVAKQIVAEGVATVAINSNDLDRYPQDGPEAMKPFAAEHGWDFPYLIDGGQEVAKAFRKLKETQIIKESACMPSPSLLFSRHGTRAMDCPLGGFGDEAGDLPLCGAGGGPALCLRAG